MGVTRMDLYEFLTNKSLLNEANTVAVRSEMTQFVSSTMTDYPKEEIENKISLFSCKILSRWKATGRNKKYFLKRNAKWLSGNLIVHKTHLQQHIALTTPEKRTRTPKNFDSSCTRTKRRRTQSLVQGHSPEELAFATQMGYTKQGKRNVAHVIKKATYISPRTLRVFKKTNTNKNHVLKYTPEEALALAIDLKLTKCQYLKLRKSAIQRNCNLYPSYDEVYKAKQECYPKDITVTETKGEVKLQSLLDHTVRRLATVQSEVVSRVAKDQQSTTLQVIYKWGFDGSSGHSLYKQKFESDSNSSDSDMFLTSIVPLKMIAKNDGVEEIVWMNPRSSSTRFCIPIKFEFKKETKELIKEENEYVEKQIMELTPTCISSDGKDINIEHTLLKTMLDGKVANTLANNPSTQSCYICKAKPSEMNNLNSILKKPCNTTTFQYGLSTLHAHIRFFECILHIAYKLKLDGEKSEWQCRGDKNKKKLEIRKSDIISKFRMNTGLLIDTVKQGAGNTNDGNTARRFFKDPKKAAEITKVDESLIYRFSVILQAISCGYKLHTENFRQYALETARLFVDLYEWYKMPASVHKILIHGADVMDTLLVPIGQLSEESLEARHKECRFFREHNTRKKGRKECLEDLLHVLLISSDMIISNLRPLPKRNANKMPADVMSLIEVPGSNTQLETITSVPASLNRQPDDSDSTNDDEDEELYDDE